MGAWNEDQVWVLTPRRVGIEKFAEWAKKNIRTRDIVVLETTTNVWATYDLVAPLASRVLVANAAEVGEIVGARVKTDKEDIKRLLKLLIGGIVPEVWVPPMHVRELRAFISDRGRLVKTSSMIRNRLQSLLHKHNLKLSEAGLLDQLWWEAQEKISPLEKMQIRQELALLREVEKLKTAIDEELERQSTLRSGANRLCSSCNCQVWGPLWQWPCCLRSGTLRGLKCEAAGGICPDRCRRA